MQMDEEQRKEEAYDFPWLPITGNLLYCMPEVGTKVALRFAEGKEEKPMVVYNLRENGKTCKELGDCNSRYLTTAGLEEFLRSENFDPVNAKEIMEQFGDYTNGGQAGTMKRRADEIDIILYDDYVREDDETRYGDIWAKKSKPNEVTKGYENIE